MKILITVAVVYTIASVHSAPYKPKVQIYEIRENSAWVETHGRSRVKTMPSSLTADVDLEKLNRPEIILYAIYNDKTTRTKGRKKGLKELRFNPKMSDDRLSDSDDDTDDDKSSSSFDDDSDSLFVDETRSKHI